MVGWIIRVCTGFLGDNDLAVRLGAFLLWFPGACFIYQLTRKVFDGSTARDATLLYAVLPVSFGLSFVMMPDSALLACWAGGLYFLYRALIEEHAPSLLGVGLFIGLGMLSKYTTPSWDSLPCSSSWGIGAPGNGCYARSRGWRSLWRP